MDYDMIIRHGNLTTDKTKGMTKILNDMLLHMDAMDAGNV